MSGPKNGLRLRSQNQPLNAGVECLRAHVESSIRVLPPRLNESRD